MGQLAIQAQASADDFDTTDTGVNIMFRGTKVTTPISLSEQ